MSKKLRGKKYKIKKLDIPDIITEDLTYYMQFGWKYKKDYKRAKETFKKYDKMVMLGIPDYYG
mgnify:CR=1 FL=1|tara:strand:+ start:509 stop:697 length:189 start_codon:yes stop_codon:yes gene_type:complete